MKAVFAALVWGIIHSAYACPGRMASRLGDGITRVF